jgi:hypothetical protein
MAFVMDNARNLFDELKYDGIYRDDGFAVFNGVKTTGEVAEWLSRFQARLDKLAGSNYLQFTAEVWGADKDDGRKYKAVTVWKRD